MLCLTKKEEKLKFVQ